MPRRDQDAGVCLPGPLRTRWVYRNDNTDTSAGAPNHREFESEVFRWNPRLRIDRFEDFDEEVDFTDTDEPLSVTSSTVAADVGKSEVTATANQVTGFEITVPRSGFIDTIDFVGGTTLTANDTNFVTFAVTNKLAAGSGAIAILATGSGVNTTMATGGGTWTAFVPAGMTLSAVAGALRVSEGDVLSVSITVSGTLANAVLNPEVRLRIRHDPKATYRPRSVRTAGSPGIQQAVNSANGILTMALDATSELQYAGIDNGNQLIIPGTKRWYFEAMLSIPTAITTAQDVIIGMGTAFNSTLASITKFARFRLNASMALLFESADGTTTNTTAALNRGGITLLAGTTYLFTIDARSLTAVRFFVNDTQFATANMAALAVTDLLQPMIGVRKSTGTTTPILLLDYLRTCWNRI